MKAVVIGMLLEEDLVRMKKYLISKLQDFGCPDSYLDHTADTMLNDLLKIMKQETKKK